MAPFSDHDDAAYAADAEGPTPSSSSSGAPGASLRHQRSMQNRQFSLYASRLRHHSPSTKHDATANPLGLETPLAASSTSEEDPNFNTTSRGIRSPRTRPLHDRSPIAENSDNYEDDPPLHPLRLLPVSPASPISSAAISPRWASLANSPTALYKRTVSPTGFASTAPTSPRSPTFAHSNPHSHPHPHSNPNPAPRSHPDSNPASRSQSPASASRFLGLNSHPFVTQVPTPDRSSASTLDSTAASVERKHEQRSASPAVSLALEDHSAQLSSPSEFPSPSASSPNGTMLVGNFSRPHKPSVKLGPRDIHPAARRWHPEPLHIEHTASPVALTPQPSWSRERPRGLSVSSTRSTSTFGPSLHNRPSHEQMRTATRNATVPIPAGGMISPGLPRPPAAYSRMDGRMDGRPDIRSASANGYHTTHGYHTHNHMNGGGGAANGTYSRELLPWIADDELRSSYRSEMSSTTQEAGHTAPGTERSSFGTKTSSRTSMSCHANMGMTFDEHMDYDDYDDGEGLSVEDVMGMYAKGFADSTDAEDNTKSGEEVLTDIDGFEEINEINEIKTISLQRIRVVNSQTSQPSRSSQQSQPSQQSALPPSEHLVRNSAAFFHNSNLPPSPPHDDDFELDDEDVVVSPVESDIDEANEAGEVSDEAVVVLEKRDSAKMLESDEHPKTQGSAASGDAEHVVDSMSVVAEEAAGDATTSVEPALENSTSNLGISVTDERPGTSHTASVFPLTKPDEPDARDRYGFRKKNQYITREQYDAWNGPYSQYIERRRKKWVAYLKDSGLMTENPKRFPQPSVKTKRFVRKGIPPEWRGAAWFYYAGGPSIVAKHPGTYDSLVQRAANGEAKPVDIEAIERDLHRTFPDNIAFQFTGEDRSENGDDSDEEDMTKGRKNRKMYQGDDVTADRAGEPPIVSRLRRVLLAFSIYNPRIGYCQSLNFLAGLLLLFVQTEEHCFWLLNVITRIYLPGTHDLSLEGSKVDLSVLMTALQNSLPHVWAKIGGDLDEGAGHHHHNAAPAPAGRRMKLPRMGGGGNNGAAVSSADRLPPITLCMTAWFMSCFIGTLPMETTLRVWDIFFYEGSKTLFRVALAVFKLGEAEIRAVKDPMEMFGVVQSLPRRLLDCNMVMEATFRRRNGFGHISQENIEEKRREQRDVLKESRPAGSGIDSDDMGDDDGLTPPHDVHRKNTLFGRPRRERRPTAEMM